MQRQGLHSEQQRSALGRSCGSRGGAEAWALCKALCLRCVHAASRPVHGVAFTRQTCSLELVMLFFPNPPCSELDLLLSAARRLGVRPSIGIRAKLSTRHGGHWGSTSGDKAKVRGCEAICAAGALAGAPSQQMSAWACGVVLELERVTAVGLPLSKCVYLSSLSCSTVWPARPRDCGGSECAGG